MTLDATRIFLESMDIHKVSGKPIHVVSKDLPTALKLRDEILRMYVSLEAKDVQATTADKMYPYLMGLSLDRIFIDPVVYSMDLDRDNDRMLKIIAGLPDLSTLTTLVQKGDVKPVEPEKTPPVVPKRKVSVWTKFLDWLRG